MNKKRHFLFLYDIHKQSTLRKIVKLLDKMNAYRIQYSVFEILCSLEDVASLVNQVSFLIDEKNDKVAIIPLGSDDFEKTVFFGHIPRRVSPLPEYYVL